MAFIGMRHVVGCEFDSHTEGSEPTYKSGAGFDVGKAITGNLTISRNDNPLRADDGIAEDDNGITGIDLELGLDDLLEEIQDKLGLLKAVSAGTPAVTTYYESDASSKDVGVGYMRVRQKNNTITFQAIWIYKIKFSRNSESSQTKGESIEWQTPTISGHCVGLNVDDDDDRKYRKIRNFDTESAAAAYLDGLANISRTRSANPPGRGELPPGLFPVNRREERKS